MKKLQQFNVIALCFDRLKNNNFNLTLGLIEAERNEELIALADNECLRAIRRITNHPFNDDGENRLMNLFLERKQITKQENSKENRKRIAEINNEIRELLYIPDIVSITTPKKSDYKTIGKNGFYINGKHYRRLMCSAAMARTNRALFCTDEIYPPLDEILRCGCKQTKIVPAKWNAYYSLMSSAAFQVSTPRVCVIPDLNVKMYKDVDWATPNEHQDVITHESRELEFNLWDGMGLISPELSKKWSEEIGYDGVAESFIVRAPFIKGLVATFDFHRFAKEIAKNEIIKDIYGKEYNCNDIDIILTESQFKLWKGYDDMASYEEAMKKYGICWGVTKIGAPENKKTMRTNYQFIQVLDLDDDSIKQLCEPTLDWFKNISGGNLEYKLLYSLGKIAKFSTPNEVWDRTQDVAIKALMLEPDLMQDTYLTNKIINSIRKKIKQSYIGKLIVNGSFNFLYFDPYALAEYAFGIEVRGLLNEFEFYADFWDKKGCTKIAALRSPMTWRAEVNVLNLLHTEKMRDWYRYIPNGVILNIWGNDRDIFSGADADGDSLATTDNLIFINKCYGGRPVLYEHQAATKEIIEK